MNQDVILNSLTFHCDYCDKNLTSKENLLNHQHICVQKFIKEKTKDDKEILDLSRKINDLETLNSHHKNLEVELEYYKNRCEDLQEEMNDLLKEIALCALGCNNAKIESLTKKYVKKQKRVDYKERNVVYILTTDLMKKERRYILGKAVNLTNRLSTYNISLMSTK